MALLADSTLVHMEALSAIDRIERGLEQLHRATGDAREAMRTSDRLAHHAVRLRSHLEEFFERERLELFPRVRRICGAEMNEVQQLVHTQQRVLEALDRFISDLTDQSADDTTFDQNYLGTLEGRFEKFVDHFDRRCNLQRSFYRSFSTILFPGGVATD